MAALRSPTRPGRAVAAAALLLVASAGRARAATSDQVWPELKLYLPFNDRVRLLLLADANLDPRSGFIAGEVGADVEIEVSPLRAMLFPTIQLSKRERATLDVGYRRLGTFVADDESEPRENRFLAAVTFRLLLPDEILASDRNRFEGRDLDGEWSWRYRNRLQLDRRYDVGALHVDPTANVEIFYDSREGDVARVRVEVGGDVEELLGPETVLEVYLLRQYDFHKQPTLINGLGITVEIYW
jgi:hypothetical protein